MYEQKLCHRQLAVYKYEKLQDYKQIFKMLVAMSQTTLFLNVWKKRYSFQKMQGSLSCWVEWQEHGCCSETG